MSSALKATAIDHIVMHVKDLQRAKRFYTEVLGLTVRRERQTQLFLNCGENQIGLFELGGGRGPATEEIHHMALQLESGDYEHVKAALEQAGVEVHGRAADPDGHGLQLLMPGEH